MRTGILSSVLCLVSLPGAIAVTLLLHPFWSWIKAHLGIEAVGHSGSIGLVLHRRLRHHGDHLGRSFTNFSPTKLGRFEQGRPI